MLGISRISINTLEQYGRNHHSRLFKMEAKGQSTVIESDHHSSSTTLWPLRQATYAESVGTDDEENEDISRTWWVKTSWFQHLVQVCALVSLISTAMNSPETFKSSHVLKYLTLIFDIVVAVVFTTEMIAQVNMWGLWTKQKAYLRRPRCIFNASMLFLICLSIVLQIVEISGGYVYDSSPEKIHGYVGFSILRAPRALIIIRFFNVLITINLPKSVARRCKRQIWAVTLFLLYFMAFGSIIGVQLFGRKNFYCVKNGADLKNITYNDLLLTDHRCNNISGETGYFCPQGFKCVHVDFQKSAGGGTDNNYFGHFLYGILTVYESSTQEGWVLVMYRMMDFRSHALVIVYFVLLIFFVAWLVKNVFIAVVSETFADIRSLYMYSRKSSKRTSARLASQVIKDGGSGWHLISVDHEAVKGHAPLCVRQIVHSIYFKYTMWFFVLVDALMQATLHFSWRRYAQFAFTIIFDLEVLLKISCMGFRPYLVSRMQLTEFVLAVGSTVFALPILISEKAAFLAVFNVMRVIRLVSAIPTLQGFCEKIFGTGKKLGSAVMFTLFFVMVSSVISMQFFLTLDPPNFGTFMLSVQSMFQIITQEGWVEILDELIHKAENPFLAALVAIIILAVHLFSSLIIMSVFVAVILDNLELDEEVKIMKQKKMGGESRDSTKALPMRLRVFERFRDDPRLVRMSRIKTNSDFSTPKIRDSFMKKFIDSSGLEAPVGEDPRLRVGAVENLRRRRTAIPLKLLNSTISEVDKMSKFVRKQSSITALINESNRRRTYALLSPTELSPRNAVTGNKQAAAAPSVFRSASRRFRNRQPQPPRTTPQGDVKQVMRMASQATGLHSQINQDETNIGKDFDIQWVRVKREEAQRKRKAQEEKLRENHPYFDQPLFSLQRDSWLRRFLQNVVNARYIIPKGHRERASRNHIITLERLHRCLASQTYLEWIMIFVTLISCIAMMFETPTQRTFVRSSTEVIEYIFVVAMSIELGVRILADGLIFTPNAVIQDFGGVLDVFIYFVALAYVAWQPDPIPARSGAQVLMVLRCLRPLRIVTLVPKMQKVILELVGGYKEILKVSALQFMLMFIFASYGVQVFAGKFGSCNDQRIKVKAKCKGTFQIDIAPPRELRGLPGTSRITVPRVWKNPRNFDFDNILHAFLALFEVLSLEGWLEVRDVIQAVVAPEYSLYVHIYVLIGSMIGLTLFVGVIVMNFNEKKGIALLTVDQRRWQDLKKRLRLAQPLHLARRPDNEGIRSFLFDATQSLIYKRIIIFLVVLDCVTLTIVQWTSEDNLPLRDGLTSTAAACSLLFVVDLVLKIIAFTFRGYWQSRRNRFDLLLTSLGVLWVTLNFSLKGTQAPYSGATVFGMVIILFRFLTLSGKHDTLKMLMLTVVMSLVKSFFIIAVLLLIMVSYSLGGVILFGTVKYGEALNRRANFKTSFNALILLFRITTGEDWNKIMHDCMLSRPYCTENANTPNFWETDCGNPAAAIIYFMSFYVLVTFVFLNLFIAVIIENFSLFYSSDEDSLISNTDLRDFQLTWNLVDKYRKGVLTVRQAKLVLRLLKGRLEVDSGSLLFKHMCCEIEKLRNGGEVSFHDVIGVLAYRSVDISRSLQLEELLEREELEYQIEEEVAIQTIRDWFINLRRKRVEREWIRHLEQGGIPLAGGFQFADNKSPGASSVESVENSPNEDQEREERDTEAERDTRDHDSSEDDDFSDSSPSMGPSILLSAPSTNKKSERKVSPGRKNYVTFPDEPSMSANRRGLPDALGAVKVRKKSLPEVKEFAGDVRDWWTGQLNDGL